MPVTEKAITQLSSLWRLHFGRYLIHKGDAAAFEAMENDCNRAANDDALLRIFDRFQADWYGAEIPTWHNFAAVLRRQTSRWARTPGEDCFFCYASGNIIIVAPRLFEKWQPDGYLPGEPYTGRGRLYSAAAPCSCAEPHWDDPLGRIRALCEAWFVKASGGDWPMAEGKYSPRMAVDKYIQLELRRIAAEKRDIVPQMSPIVPKTDADDVPLEDIAF